MSSFLRNFIFIVSEHFGDFLGTLFKKNSEFRDGVNRISANPEKKNEPAAENYVEPSKRTDNHENLQAEHKKVNMTLLRLITRNEAQ